MRESDIEHLLCRAVEAIGGKAFKFTAPGNAGVPDRVVLIGGRAYFVEVKAPGEQLRPLQCYRQRQFARLGFTIHVIDSPTKVTEFIRGISEGGDPFHV